MKEEASVGATRRRLLRLPSSAIADAAGRNGAMHSDVRRLGGGPLAGRAVTAHCERHTVGAMFRALAAAAELDVLCVRGEGAWAYFGELAGAEAVRRGLGGVVVDRLVRDLDGLVATGLPLFARGTIAVGGSADGAGAVGSPVEIGGKVVRPGDWVVGDADGVVVVPQADIERVAASAEAICRAEADTLARIASGQSLFDVDRAVGSALGEKPGR